MLNIHTRGFSWEFDFPFYCSCVKLGRFCMKLAES